VLPVPPAGFAAPYKSQNNTMCYSLSIIPNRNPNNDLLNVMHTYTCTSILQSVSAPSGDVRPQCCLAYLAAPFFFLLFGRPRRVFASMMSCDCLFSPSRVTTSSSSPLASSSTQKHQHTLTEQAPSCKGARSYKGATAPKGPNSRLAPEPLPHVRLTRARTVSIGPVT